MQIAGHDIERWFALIAGASAAGFAIVRTTKSLWKFFWKVTKAVVSEVIEPAFNKLEAKVDGVDSKVDGLDHYTRYHLGPNDTTKPVFKRIERIEYDNEIIKMRQVSQHRENKKSIGEFIEKVSAGGDQLLSDQELLDLDHSRSQGREAQRRSREDPPPRP